MYITHESGFEFRFDKTTLAYSNDRFDKPSGVRVSISDAKSHSFHPFGKFSDTDKTDLFLWGDSHAQAIFPAFDEYMAKNNISGKAAVYPGVLPAKDYVLDRRIALGTKAPIWNQAIFEFIVANNINDVLLVAAWKDG